MPPDWRWEIFLDVDGSHGTVSGGMIGCGGEDPATAAGRGFPRRAFNLARGPEVDQLAI